jgi:hypothetical protein
VLTPSKHSGYSITLTLTIETLYFAHRVSLRIPYISDKAIMSLKGSNGFIFVTETGIVPLLRQKVKKSCPYARYKGLWNSGGKAPRILNFGIR